MDKHPSTRGKGVNLFRERKKERKKVWTKWLLPCSLIPSNITFQHSRGLQARGTPALPTGRIVGGKDLFEPSRKGLWWDQVTYSDSPHQNQ